MKDTNSLPSRYGEPFVTKKEASAALNIPYFKIQRAAKQGLIPTYQLLNSREYVKVSEIHEVMFRAGLK